MAVSVVRTNIPSGVCVSGAQAAAKAKRAEAERMAVADAQKIVAIRNARQAVGARYGFIRRSALPSRLAPMADILLPLRTIRVG